MANAQTYRVPADLTLSSAFSLALAGDVINVAAGGSYTTSSALTVPNGVTVLGNGSVITLTGSSPQVFKFTKEGSHMALVGWKIDCDGELAQDTNGAAVFGEGVQDTRVEGCEILHFNTRAIDFKSSKDAPPVMGRPILRCYSIGNYVHTPVSSGPEIASPGHPILFRNGAGNRHYGRDCHSIGDRVWGTDPEHPQAGGHVAEGGTFPGDLIVFQGMENSTIERPFLRYGGEIGADFTRLSKDCQLIRPDIKYMDKHGFTLGSGYMAVQLGNVTGTFVDQAVLGVTSGTEGIVNSYDAVNHWLYITKTGGDMWVMGETVETASGASASGNIVAIRHSCENTHVFGGQSIENGLGGSATTPVTYYGNGHVQLAADCSVNNIDLQSREGGSVLAGSLYISSAKVGFKGLVLGGADAGVVQAGAYTELHFADLDLVAGGRIRSNGSIAHNVGIASVTKSFTGVYEVNLLRPLTSTDRAVVSVSIGIAPSPTTDTQEIVYSITSETLVTVRTYKAGAATDLTFGIAILQ